MQNMENLENAGENDGNGENVENVEMVRVQEDMDIVLGTMNIEYPFSSASDPTYEHYFSILEYYVSHIKQPILDTAYYYGNTKTEKVLGELLPRLSRQPIIATKANPWFHNDFANGRLGQLSEAGILGQLNTSLNHLGREKADIFYLHCPDYETPLVETLETCERLWRIEKLDALGISNFSKMQFQEILDLCDKYGFQKPKYYQGMYNLLCRKVEEIFPLLDEYRISFWGYNPLAGGLLTGKYKEGIPIQGSRFSGNAIYQSIFWKSNILKPMEEFMQSPHCLRDSFSWLYHHSKLRNGYGHGHGYGYGHESWVRNVGVNKMILGVSTVEQLKQNLDILAQPSCLSQEDILYMDSLYSMIEKDSPEYFY